LEVEIGKITGPIIFIITSELPSTNVLSLKGTIEHREAHRSLLILICISQRAFILHVY
jgi:hypothetical protein